LRLYLSLQNPEWTRHKSKGKATQVVGGDDEAGPITTGILGRGLINCGRECTAPCPLLGAKRTSPRLVAMSAYDPKRTSPLYVVYDLTATSEWALWLLLI
jgi:hypothetical protein